MRFRSLAVPSIFRHCFDWIVQTHFQLSHKAPKVRSIFDSKRVAIAIDECLAMFDDETFSNCKCLNFDATIDCLTLSSNGAIVICGLTNGAIHGIHIKGVPVFNVYVDCRLILAISLLNQSIGN